MEKKKRIYCFPYAGGSSYAFRDIADKLSLKADVVLLDYPGHGSRFGEDFADNMESLAKEMSKQVMLDMKKYSLKNCVFLGHSMGAIVAYEAAKKIDGINIEKLILCGSLPPDMERDAFGADNKDEAFDKFYKMGWIPDEVRDDQELYDIFSEIMFSDICILRTIDVGKGDDMINIPLSIYFGKEDSDCDTVNMTGWKKKTTQNCSIHMVTGDHFFLFKYPEVFCDTIIAELFL